MVGHGSPANEAPGGEPTVALYVQRPVAGERTEAIDRLDALNADGAIASLEIRTVGEEVVVPRSGERDPDAGVADLATLAEWRGPDVRPTFHVRDARTRTGRTVRKCAPPSIALGVHAGGNLVCVFPCTDGDRDWSVADFLDSYEDGRDLPEGVGVDLGTA